MESSFDNEFQFLKRFDVKAHGKPPKKKKWLLSRQYLQPLTEPDDEDSARDDQDHSSTGYKKKLKCAYEAAKYGMKEGVLTGVFLGGCWGIFKHLGENFTPSFQGSKSVGDEKGGEKNAAGIPPQGSPDMRRRPSRKEPSLGSVTSTERYRNPAPKSSDVYQESISSYKKSLAVVREKSHENYYNTSNRLINKYGNSKLPIRSNKQYPPLRSGGAGVYVTNGFNFRRNREKVEIVGYAFIQTTGSITGENSGSGSIKSSGSDSPKNTGSTSQKDEERKFSSDDKSKTSVAGSSSSRKRTKSESESIISSEERKFLQSASQSVGSANQSMKSDGSHSKRTQSLRSTVGSSNEKLTKGSLDTSGSIIGELARSKTSARGSEHSRSTLPDVVEETQNATPVSIDRTGSIQTEDDFQQRISEQTSTQDSSLSNMISGTSSMSYSDSSYQEVNNRIKITALNTAENRNRRSGKETSEPVSFNVGPRDSENIYPDPKKTSCFLVDVDALSNGFVSPKTRLSSDIQSRTQIPVISSQDESDICEIDTNSPDYINSTSTTSAISRIDTESQKRYRVESSPKFNGSNFTDMQDDVKDRIGSSLTGDRSYSSDSEDRNYRVESSPDYKRSRVDARFRAGSSPTFRSEAQDERRYSAEGSFVSNLSYVSETPEERSRAGSSPTFRSEAQDERRYSAEGSFVSNLSYVNETPEGRSRAGSSPLYNRSYVSETPEERNFGSYVSETQDEGIFMLARSPTYTKSYINGIHDEGISRVESTASHKRSYVSAAETLDRSTGISKHSGAIFSGRGRDSVGSSAGYVKSQISAVHNGKKHSENSPAYSRSALEEIQSPMVKAEHGGSQFKDKSSISRNELTGDSYLGYEREVSAAAVADVAKAVGSVSPPKRAATVKGGSSGAVQKGEEVAKKSERSSRAFSFLSAVNENIIVLSACNCAIVLGVICSVISITRASLAV